MVRGSGARVGRLPPLASILLLLLSAHMVVASPLALDGGAEYLVDLGEDPLVLDQLVANGCRPARLFDLFRLLLVECPRSVERLGKKGVLPNLVVSKAELSLRKVGGLSKFGGQEGGYTTAWSWAVSRIGADMVWSYLGTRGEGVVLAVLDTGIDPEHPLLAGKLLTANPADPTYPGGWIEFDRKGRPVCSRPRDLDGHGTWVSSILVGGDASNYVFGVAPEAKLMVASVLPGGYGTFAQVLAGLEWVLRPYDCHKRYVEVPRPLVVSMSLGALGNYSNVFLPAIERLLKAGIVVVAAIGNGGPYSSSNPGNIWGVIGVGATDFDDRVAYFSSYEEVEWPYPPASWPFKGQYPKRYPKPDLVAPGVEIPGALPGGLLAIGSGTSAATPIVAGVAALVAKGLMSKGLSGVGLVEAVYEVLTSTAAALDQPGSGYGRVRSYPAVARATDARVEITYVSVSPYAARPGDRVRVTAGIPPGRTVDVYISGIRAYSGAYPAAGVTVAVPSTHMGGNTVTVVSTDGALYGETLLSVAPVMVVPSNMTSGRAYDVYISGLGPGDTIIVYASGNTLLIDSANLRGTLRAKIIAPFVSEAASIQFAAEDLSAPGVYLSATVLVAPPANRPSAVEAPRIDVRTSVGSYYVVGGSGTVKVLLPHEGFSVSVRQVYPNYSVLKVTNLSYEGNLAVFTIEITGLPREGVAFIEVVACYQGVCAKSIEPINIVPVDVVKSLADVLSSLQMAVGGLNGPTNAGQDRINELSAALSKLNQTVTNLSEELGRIVTSFKALNGTVSAALSKLNQTATNLSEELGRIVTSFAALEGTVFDISDRVKRAEGEGEELRVDLEGVKTRLRGLEGEVSELRRDLGSVSGGLGRLGGLAMAALLVSLAALAVAVASLFMSMRVSPER